MQRPYRRRYVQLETSESLDMWISRFWYRHIGGPNRGRSRSGNPAGCIFEGKEKRGDSGQCRFQAVCLVPAVLLVALSTVDWFARRRHERYFRVGATVGAFDFRHLPGGTVTSILITHFRFPPSLFSSYTKDNTRRDNRHGPDGPPVIPAGKISSILTMQEPRLL